MFLKRFFTLFFVVAMVILGVSAQDSSDAPASYTAAAYLPDSGTLLVLDNVGISAELVLPLPDGFDRNASAVAALATQVAYVARKQGATDKALVLSNVTNDGAAISLSGSTPLRSDAAYTSFYLRAPGTFGLRNGKTHIALGYGLDPLGWELLVLNDQLQEVAKIDQFDLPDQPKDYGFTPYPIDFRPDGSIAFALVNAQATEPQTPSIFIWNTFTGAMTQTTAYAIEIDTYAQTGEVVSVKNGGLQWFDSYSGEGARFYVASSEGETMNKARFASDGRYVVVQKGGRLVVVGRDGAEIGALLASETAVDWYGLRDGLVMTLNTEDAVSLYRVSLANGLPADASGYSLLTALPVGTNVQWADSDMRDGLRLIDYTEWASLDGAFTDAVVVSGVSPVVASQPVEEVDVEETDVEEAIAAEGLYANGWATTFTDDGDQLNVRGGAGTSFDVVTRVVPGILVHLVEGPVAADGFVWWHVTFPTGTDGWLVQEVAGVQTLLPAAPQPLPTATPVPSVPQPPEVVLNDIAVYGSTQANSVQVVFSWTSFPGTVSYLIEILYCNDGVNCSEGFSSQTARTELSSVFSVNANLPIRWRVTARDANGATLFQTEYQNSIVSP